MVHSLRIGDIVYVIYYILDVFSPKFKCKAYVSFVPISAEENKNLFQHFHKVYKHGNDESFP